MEQLGEGGGGESIKDDNLTALLPFLESLRTASKDLRRNSNPIFFATYFSPAGYSSAIETDLIPQAETLLAPFNHIPNLSKLAQVLSGLKTLLGELKDSRGYTLKLILRRQLISYQIYQASFAIEAEIQRYIDHELVKKLVTTLGRGKEDDDEEEEEEEEGAKSTSSSSSNEDKVISVLKELEKRLLQGFDREFQELVLKGRVFYLLESLLCEPCCDTKIRELAAGGILALVRFNKDVFVGLVLMGPIVKALISMASGCSVRVLCSLIKLVRTPLVDEMESGGLIPRVVGLLASRHVDVRVGGVGCVCEIAYVGRKEVVREVLELGVVEKLVELQRSSDDRGHRQHCNNGLLVDDDDVEKEKEEEEDEGVLLGGRWPMFTGCVSRFAVQVEVGEGLSRKERKEFKLEILRRVREASVSEAEASSIVAEVLWGSSP